MNVPTYYVFLQYYCTIPLELYIFSWILRRDPAIIRTYLFRKTKTCNFHGLILIVFLRLFVNTPPPHLAISPATEEIHYSDVIIGAMASQIAGVSIVYSTVCSGTNQIKQQSSASLAFVRGIHRWSGNSPHKGSVTRKVFPFNAVIMSSISAFHLYILQGTWWVVFHQYYHNLSFFIFTWIIHDAIYANATMWNHERIISRILDTFRSVSISQYICDKGWVYNKMSVRVFWVFLFRRLQYIPW